MKKIVIAGSTGYLGKHLVEQAILHHIPTIALARNPRKLDWIESEFLEKVSAEVTKPDTLKGLFKGVDTVISTVGITRQKDGLTYMDVDYQANMNLLEEAKKAGVRKFIYVSAFRANEMRHLKMAEAKEKFVDQLKVSGIEYTIMRPTGFFSDMGDFLEMAKKGRVYLFGKGQKKLNPIHGEDLANVCLDAISSSENEISVGGPDSFTHDQLATLALKSLNKPIKILHLPDWMRRFTIWVVRTFTSAKTYGPIEFFLTAMAFDMDATKHGIHHLKDYYSEVIKEERAQ